MTQQCMTIEEALCECDEDLTPLFFDHESQECMIIKLCDEMIEIVPTFARPDKKCDMVRAILRVPNCSGLNWFYQYGNSLCGDKGISDHVYARVMQLVSESITSMERNFYQHFDYQLEIRQYLLGQCPIYYRGIDAVRGFSRMIQLIDDDRVFLWEDLEPHWPFLRNFPKMIHCGDKVWYDNLALKTYAGWIPNDNNFGIIKLLGEEKVFDVCVYALSDGISKCKEDVIFKEWFESLNIITYIEEFLDVSIQELFVKFMFSQWCDFEDLCNNLRVTQLNYVQSEMAWDKLRGDNKRLVADYACIMVASGILPVDIVKTIISYVIYEMKYNPRILRHKDRIASGECVNLPVREINRLNRQPQMYGGYDDKFGRCSDLHYKVFANGVYTFRSHCCLKHCADYNCDVDMFVSRKNNWVITDIGKYNRDGMFLGCDTEIIDNVMVDHECDFDFCYMCRIFDVDFISRNGFCDVGSTIVELDDVG